MREVAVAHPLENCCVIDDPPGLFLRRAGAVFAEFDERTQDSGNISYGVRIDGHAYFVKTAGHPDNGGTLLGFPSRVERLRNAARLMAVLRHPALPPFYGVIESPFGPLLVYDWVEGVLLHVPSHLRGDPDSALNRFLRLPSLEIQACLDAVYDLHEEVERAGWVAVDFYDGCLIYDFAARRLTVVDLDEYQPGPFHNEMGRMFGSSRFMAPEEFIRGAAIDYRTNVFVMGRAALVLLSDGTLNPDAFRGSPAQREVVFKACRMEPDDRYPSIAAFCHAWRSASPV